MMTAFAGKVVLVTGGAAGIGQAACRCFARQGAQVVFSDLSEASGKALEDELVRAGQKGLFIRSDALDEAQVEALVARACNAFGRLDVAINNVGRAHEDEPSTARLHEIPLEAWKGSVERNLTSTFLAMKYEIRAMLRQSGGGVIANTASLAGLRVAEHAAPGYSAAKAAVIHMSRKAAVQYAKHGIRVNVVAPGLTTTEQLLARLGPEMIESRATANHPMGRMVTPDEVAEAFVWLCSDAASGVTGIVVPVDGGWSAS